jgi:DNA invertase Pin-like site-specific DNA recombinase
VRCAIYTRKSTEEGLDQAFNSLDAQREACAAYVASQRHEGWTLVADQYDDGGYSGGNMDRPGLRRLMADVRAGRIDVIVVYKIDRLTRSLSDFSKIVEVLDKAEASFVSVTQSFNTTTSMGRLTLNVLLSFAQFEREVISERVRDKVAASKARGMWMGGVVPLGYDVRDRKLVVNEGEAETIRHIMRRYLELGTVTTLVDALEAEGLRTKRVVQRGGHVRGGIPYRRGPLYHLLKNRLYLGEICHKNKSYPGQHQAIVDPELFEAVQAKLAENAADRRDGVRAVHPSLLTGVIRDEHDRPLSPTHSVKGSRRYRYYTANTQVEAERAHERTWRLPAAEIEGALITGFAMALNNPVALCADEMTAGAIAQLRNGCAELALRLESQSMIERRRLLQQLDLRAMIEDRRLVASFCVARLFEQLSLDAIEPRRHVFVACALSRCGAQEQRVIVAPAVSKAGSPDESLILFLAEAQRARRKLASMPFDDSEAGGIERRALTRVARFAFLAPDIVAAIFDGRHPRGLTPRQMKRVGDLPLSWDGQRRALGFAS